MYMIRLLVIALSLTATLSGCGHGWAWKQADLDRNRLDLARFRGADTGHKLAGWVEHGEVVAAEGSMETDEEVTLVVRYERRQSDWTGSADVEIACYRFAISSRDTVSFGSTGCPTG